MWQPKGQRARSAPERGHPAREIRGSSEMAGSSPPFRTSASTEPDLHRASCNRKRLAASGPPGSLRLPTGTCLKSPTLVELSCRWHHGRQRPERAHPLTRSNPSRMLASGTERKRSPNEAPAPHAPRSLGNEKRQLHQPPGPSRKALESPKPEPRNPARSSRARWRGTGRAPTTRLFERAAEILGGSNPSPVPYRSKAQGSNERQPVATPSAAADLTRGARP